MLSNELLKEALMLSLEETAAFHKQAGEENPHRFSLAYKLRKRSIIRLAKRYEAEKAYIERYETEKPHTERHFMPLRRLALFMAIIAAAVVLSVGAYAAYLIINGFVFNVQDEYSDVTLDISEYQLKDSIAELYWIPPESGCECVAEMLDDKCAVYNYEWNGKEIVFTQYTKYVAENTFGVNTENADVYGVKVSANDGFITTIYREKADEAKEITWAMDGYVFNISGLSIEENDLIKLAESAVIKEFFE